MKKQLILCVLFIVLVVTGGAKSVDANTARTLATHFWSLQLEPTRQGQPAPQLADLAPDLGFSHLYVWQRQDGDGFVIMAGDDRALPILGYSDHGRLDLAAMPDNFRAWLGGYEHEIAGAIAYDLPQSASVAAEWAALADNQLLSPKSVTAVSPLLSTTWDQGSPYNAMCPGSGYSRAPTGCVATAMAQVMKYWAYPPKGCGSNSYHCEYYNTTLSANFGATTYSWSNMPNSVSAYSSNSYVATLMFHCGVAVNMKYEPSGSGAQTVAPYANYPSAETAFKYNFGYSDKLVGRRKSSYSDAEWINMLKADLDAGRPVMYSGFDESLTDGHAFVCDGYNSNNYFHFNWGWSGSNDGYFAVSSLNPGSGGWGSSHYDFTYGQQAIFGVEPPALVMNSTFSLSPNSTTIQHGSTVGFGATYKNTSGSVFNGSVRLILEDEHGMCAQVLGNPGTANIANNATATINASELITVAPGSYKLALQFQANGSNDWSFAGIGGGANLLDVTVVLNPDNYEDNDNTSSAYVFTPNFSNNQATVSTTGSNFHVGDSYDYYKINLPSGYRYTVNVRLHDAGDSGNGHVYTNDAVFRISQNGGSWGVVNDVTADPFVLNDGGQIVYKVYPNGSLNPIGTYLMVTEITRTLNAGIEDNGLAVSVFPNPTTGVLHLTCDVPGSVCRLYDLLGKLLLTESVVDGAADFDLTGLDHGIYLMRLTAPDGVVTTLKVVKE